MCHICVGLFLHPRKISSLLCVMLQPVFLKNSLQPASTNLDAAIRLLRRPGVWCALRALSGSLFKSIWSVSVMGIFAPEVCRIVLRGSYVRALLAGADSPNRLMLAPVLCSTIALRLGGFAQPGARKLFAIKEFIIFNSSAIPAGAPHHPGFEFLPDWAPPIVLSRVASS